jgi:hypothetical protein
MMDQVWLLLTVKLQEFQVSAELTPGRQSLPADLPGKPAKSGFLQAACIRSGGRNQDDLETLISEEARQRSTKIIEIPICISNQNGFCMMLGWI